jgi:K+-sensing histidine kinase KdpD
MKEDSEALFYTAAGPIAAIVIGAALTPLRELTPAANFTFVFIALTIVVAELGGRAAGVLTALVSALSLDFFLTRPYLRLQMDSKHDLIAFIGLAVCGLIASALAAHRQQRPAPPRPAGDASDRSPTDDAARAGR